MTSWVCERSGDAAASAAPLTTHARRHTAGERHVNSVLRAGETLAAQHLSHVATEVAGEAACDGPCPPPRPSTTHRRHRCHGAAHTTLILTVACGAAAHPAGTNLDLAFLVSRYGDCSVPVCPTSCCAVL